MKSFSLDREKTKEEIEIIKNLPLFIPLIFLIGGIWTFGYQIITYLSVGSWPAISTNQGMEIVLGSGTWFDSPASWFGVSNILDHIPFSIFLIILSIVIMLPLAKWFAWRTK